MNILKIVGAFFVFLATLIPWAHATYWGVTEHWNLFKAGGFNRFIAIIVLLLSLVLIAWRLRVFYSCSTDCKCESKVTGDSIL